MYFLRNSPLLSVKKFSHKDKRRKYENPEYQTTHGHLHAPRKDMSAGSTTGHTCTEKQNKSADKSPYQPFENRSSFGFSPA